MENMQKRMQNHIPGVKIREAVPSDARALNQYIRKTFTSSRHLITRAEEFRTGPFKQRLWIAKKQSSPVEICFVAIAEKRIVGMLDNWTDRRTRVAHNTCFAMSVDEDWQRLGIGKTLLNTFIQWVKHHASLERIELHVHSDNLGAIALYEGCGFMPEGIRKAAVRYSDGRTVDDHIMAIWP